MLRFVESTSSAWHMSLFLTLSMCGTFELIVKQYAYSCKCVVKKLHSWFLINRVKSFPTFFTPSHCLFLFATQHQKSASCTGFQCSFQIIQCRSQLILQWFSCEQMGHPKGTPFPPVNPVKSQEINSDLEAFLSTFQQKFRMCSFLGEWLVGGSEKCSTPNGSCNPLLITTVGGHPAVAPVDR